MWVKIVNEIICAYIVMFLFVINKNRRTIVLSSFIAYPIPYPIFIRTDHVGMLQVLRTDFKTFLDIK